MIGWYGALIARSGYFTSVDGYGSHPGSPYGAAIDNIERRSQGLAHEGY